MNEQEREQLKRRVAVEVMGYWVYHYDKDYARNCYYCLLDRDVIPVNWRYPDNERPTEEEAWGDCPDFTGSLDAVREVEDEIERRGVSNNYIYSLLDIILPAWLCQDDIAFMLAVTRATPEQRCRAALEAVKG